MLQVGNLVLFHSAKKLYFFLDPGFRKQQKFPQFFQTKREMRAGLEEYLLNFLDALAISIQCKNLLNNY